MNKIISTPDLVNPNNAHISNPGFSSSQGAVTGCIGSPNSPEALLGIGVQQIQKGGDGYGMNNTQTLSNHSSPHNSNRAEFDSYQNKGISSDTNMNSSTQHGGSSFPRRGGSGGDGGIPYYSYNNPGNSNLSTFAGSGYPPISRELNNQCPTPAMNGGFLGLFGKKTKAKKTKKKTAKKKTAKKKTAKKKTAKKKTAKKKTAKKKTAKKKTAKKKMKGGSINNLSNVAYAHGYSTGAPPALGQGQSALANPVPYQAYNNCLNTWKHTGSE